MKLKISALFDPRARHAFMVGDSGVVAQNYVRALALTQDDSEQEPAFWRAAQALRKLSAAIPRRKKHDRSGVQLELRPGKGSPHPADVRGLDQARKDAELLERWRIGVMEREAMAARVRQFVTHG